MESRMRWRVLLLDTKLSNPNHYICLAIEKALASDARVEFVCTASLGDAIATAKKNACNLFFAFDGEELHPDICARLRAVCGLAVLWVTEDPYELPANLRHAHLFDRIFTNDSASVSAYGGRASHLPFAASAELHELPVREAADCRYDLLFVGTAWPNRVELLRTLLSGIGGLRAKLALPSNPHLPPVDLPLPVSSISWRTPNPEFVRLANVSRVVLTLHRDFSTSPGAPTLAATPGPRLFEVAMAGTCQLADGSLPELARYFEPNRELALFASPSQALEQLRHLLAHPQERNEMARAAQQRVLREHSYGHRVGKVLDGLAQTEAPPTMLAGKLAERPRVLLLAHNVIGQGTWGGVEVYIDWIRRTLGQHFDFWIYVPEHGSQGQRTVLLDSHNTVVERFDFGAPLGRAVLSCAQREEAFARLLLAHEIRTLHVHHLIGHPLSLPLVAQTLGVASMISLHDYHAVCEHFTLVGATGGYCGVEKLTESDCDYCLGATMAARPGAMARRRSWMRRVLASFHVLHANTNGVRDRVTSVYAALARHTGWSVMGVPVARMPKADTPPAEGPLRVAVPGNFTRFKGAHMLMTVFRQLSDEPVMFTVMGRVDDGLQNVLHGQGYENVCVSGAYTPERLHDDLAGHHVSLHTSMWPETWCLTLSESWRAGLVPIVTDIGALGERVRDGDNGFVVPHDRPAALVALLRELAHDKHRLAEMRGRVTEADVLYEDTHAEWLTEHYERLITLSVVATSGLLPQPLTVAQSGHLLQQQTWVDMFADSPAPAPPPPPFLWRAVRFLWSHGPSAAVRRATEMVVGERLPPGGGA
jgi:glycosyltransferase involved in cell wall biosynthesis